MISFFTGLDQHSLLRRLAEDIRHHHKSIFQPIHVISSGFLQDLWLKEQLAEENGIIANLKTHRPDKFIQWVYRLSGNQAIEQYSLQQIEWIYFLEMGESDFREKFPELDNYYGIDQVKRLALAAKAVSLLDKYQDFRPELIHRWRADAKLESSDWQEYLFVRAISKHGELIPDKSVWVAEIKTLMQQREPNDWVDNQLSTIFIFGSVSISPKLLEVLEILGEFLQINWYRVELNKDPHPLHRIAQNWSESLKRTQEALVEKFSHAEFTPLERGDYLEDENSILSKVQKTLLTNQKSEIASEDLLKDNSLEFHACHTKIREVESFYNFLIRVLDQNKTIGARDILVLLPQLDSYIGPIRTVFDTSPVSLPYRIISKGYSQEESFWSGLLQLMKFDKDQFTAVEIMELIESKPIQERFEFEDLELIRKMMSDANMIRESEGSKETETRFFSIHYGLKRLMHGFLLGKNHYGYIDAENEEVYTVDAVEGQQANELFRVLELVKLLDCLVSEKQNPRPLKSWVQWIAEKAESFLEPDMQTSKKFQRLLQGFGLIGDHVYEEINFETFAFRFSQLLEEMDKHSVEGFGGITFSELLPGRVLPKRIIAMLGMNFGEFPRTSQELSFDKMVIGEKGSLDPNPRASDQAVFLEALLASKSHFFLSFIGKSEQDNKTIPASPMVEELMDLISLTTNIKNEKFLISHPLHSYSSEYNIPDLPKLKNFLINKDVGFDFGKSNETTAEPLVQIHIWQLQSFLKDAIKYYYNHVLGIYYGDQKHLLFEKELFESDNLNKWQIQSQLLTFEGDFEERARKDFIAQGILPLRNVGKAIVEESNLEIEELKKEYLECLPLQSLNSSISIGGYQLFGELKKTNDGKMIFATVSKSKPKSKIEAALLYLFGRAVGLNSELLYFTRDERTVWNEEISEEHAKEKLGQLIDLFLEYRNKKFLFIHEIDFQKAVEEPDRERKISQAREVIKKHIDNLSRGYTFLSEYTLKEIEAGLFEEDETILHLLENIQKINNILHPILS